MSKRRKPHPASDETVARALSDFQNSAKEIDDAVRFLDRVGMCDLHDPQFVTALSNSACKAIKEALTESDAMSIIILERLQLTDPDAPKDFSPIAKIAYLWLAQCAGQAVARLPQNNAQSGNLLKQVAMMPLTQKLGGTTSLPAAIVSHPDCPPETLYFAAVSWPLKDARLVKNNSAAPEEALIALALRG